VAESVFLSPKSIAIIGASDKRGSVGSTITSNIMNGFTGTVYPVSPSRDTVFYKKAYKTVLDIPKPVDLAVIVIKNTLVADVLEECCYCNQKYFGSRCFRRMWKEKSQRSYHHHCWIQRSR
jgi:4-hydroxybutyryl-CoA synthetase (ADP-forming)